MAHINSVDLAHLLLPIRPEDHVMGPDDAPYTLVEYGDYECLECGRLNLILIELQKELGPRLRIVYRQYPLSGIHKHAQQAAEAAEAAGAQGRYWDMHNLLFENQEALGTRDLIRYAERLNLDVERFKRELKKAAHAERVRADFRAGVQNGVARTPGLFVNGTRHNGDWDKEALRRDLLGESR
jgi:protein-disulfide isomerase